MPIGNNWRKPLFAVTFIRSLVILAGLAISAQLLLGDATNNAPPSSVGIVANLPALKVKGNQIVANGRPIRLRGIDWGWWHLSGTRYTEADMQNVAKWGANTVRLAFSYYDLETDANPPVWKEDGFKDLDDVVQWGKRYGVHVILDMHVVPGGQSTLPYCAGGHNLLWTDTGAQDRFVALWSEIARRYHGRTEVAAYELMNEPDTTQKTPNALVNIDQRAITAIRAVDPDKIIVVGGDHGSGSDNLTDAMKFSDNNILYTFHFYEASGHYHDDWISTDTQDNKSSGSQDWVKIEYTFTAPPASDEMCVLLRSDNNSGSAWFDDVEVDDPSSEKVLQSSSFDADTDDYRPERGTSTALTFDSSTGHDKPGSLKVSGTTDYGGWSGQYIGIQPGQSYHVSAWLKLDQATGETYLAAAFFHNKGDIDHDAFQKKMAQATAFADKFQVPVWVGEFGCEAVDKAYQSQWVGTCTSLFEDSGFGWTYWNDKSTDSPQGMGLQTENSDGSDRRINDSLLAALQAGWALNQ
ncbi:MAG: cellulase family glycosylhydrolase [Methylacidiphilales bacterium]|nr:cellulase family glycosylhydrolase [Candidatus Methylacidiphilales bacterium]